MNNNKKTREILGEGNNVTVPLNEGHRDYYDKTVDGSILTIFSTAAFRYLYFLYSKKDTSMWNTF